MTGLIARVSMIGLFLLACSPVPGSGQRAPEVKQGNDLVVGVPIAMTGNVAAEAAQAKQGYDLWLDWVNHSGGIVVNNVRHPVRLLYEDDASQAQVAAQVAEKMVSQEGAKFLLGPYGSTDSAAVAAVAEKHHLPAVLSNAAARQIFEQGYRYSFGVLAPADQYPRGVIDMALAMDPKPSTVAILTADDAFSLLVAKGAGDYATAKGMKVIYTARYPSGTTNLYSLLEQAKAKQPDLLVNSGHLLEAIAVHKQAKDLRLDAKMFVYAVGPDTPEFISMLQSDANYVVTGSPWTAQARYKASYYLSSADYVAAYRKKFGPTEPTYATADATAAAIALQLAIEHARSLDPDRVRDALATLDVNTFYGRIKFDDHGQNIYRSMLVEQIQNGQRQTVWPPEVATASPQYPTPTWAIRSNLPSEPPKASMPSTGRPQSAGR